MIEKIKLILLAAILFFYIGQIDAQSTYEVKMGSKTYKAAGIKAFTNNDSETTVYTIKDGTFHYYYINSYNNKVVEYTHISCPVKSIDVKSVFYKDYDSKGKFMYLTTKKLVKNVIKKDIEDNKLSGPSEDINITVSEKESHSLMFILNSEEQGKTIISQIKKRKDL